jgi:hypothetical protein
MARIALAVIGGIVGGLISFFSAGALSPFAISLGMSIGGLIGGILFPQKVPTQYGPRLNERQVMSSANGSPIPWGYGTFRIAGEVIWAEKIKETKNTEKKSAKGGPTVTTVTYTYTITMAVAFCEGPADVIRLWGDVKLLFDKTGTGPQSIGTGLTSTGTGGLFKHTGDRAFTVVAPVFYRGTEDQLPDPTIQSVEGADRTGAYRGLCYAVVNDFPLADFGNRIPNIRAEITVAGTAAPRTIFPGWSTLSFTGANPNGIVQAPQSVYIDPYSRLAIATSDNYADVVSVIRLEDSTTATPVAWQAAFFYSIGDQINDSNGNIQTVVNATGSHLSGASEPTWSTTEAAATVDAGSRLTWRHSGPGLTVPVVAFAGKLLTDFDTTPHTLAREIRTYSQGYNTRGLDTEGRFWEVAYSLSNSSGARKLFRYDTASFRPMASIVAPNDVSITTLAFAKVNGRNQLYAFQITNEAESGNLAVYDCDTLELISGPGYVSGDVGAGDSPYTTASWKPRGDFNNSSLVWHPGIDPATGAAYRVCYDGIALDTNWYITILNQGVGVGGGLDRILTIPKDTVAGHYGRGNWCLFNGADGTLIVGTGFSNSGASDTPFLLKIDISDGTILASVDLSSHGIYEALWFKTPKAYKGVLPIDGQLRIPVLVSGVWYMDYYDGISLARTKRIALSTFFFGNLSATDFITDFSYDEVTNSFLVVANQAGGGGYNGLFERIWFDRLTATDALLSDVVADLIERTELQAGDINVGALANQTVKGYGITRTAESKACLQPLNQAYFFDLVESDFQIKAVLRGGSPVMVIPEDDLGISSEKSKLQEDIAQEHDLPREITVLYSDPALNNQPGKQLKRRKTKVVHTKQQVIYEFPLSLSKDDAKSIAEKLLSTVWAERNQYSFKLWNAKYLQLDPSDVVQFTYNGLPFQARLVKTSMGQNRVLEISSLSEDPRNYLAVLPGGATQGFIQTQILALGPTTLFLLDMPLLQDQDSPVAGVTGFYWAMSSPSSGWPGGVLFESADDSNYIQDDFDNDAATYGFVNVLTPAPLHSPFSWDFDTTITVQLIGGGTLSSTTMLAVLNGANAFYLGGEIIQFVNATLNADGTYTLDTLLRGRRGTEGYAKTHTIGETFILLTSGTTKRQNESTATIGAKRFYRGVTLGNPATGAGAQILTSQGLDLKPYAPAQFKASLSVGAFSISWVRRTRVGGAWLDTIGQIPLSEASESYDLEIYSGSVLKRTVSGLTTPSYFYSAANVVTDFGGAQTTIKGKVYQNSAVIGRGFPAENDFLGGFGAVSGGGDATSVNGVPIVGTPVDGDVLTYLSGANTWTPEQPTLTRADVTKTTASLANGAAETGSIAMGCASFILLRAVTTRACRLQLYSTAADRDADTRAINFLPPTGTETGVVVDLVLTDDLDWEASPPLIGANLDGTPADVIYYRITNLGTVGTVPVTLTILPMEVPRH